MLMLNGMIFGVCCMLSGGMNPNWSTTHRGLVKQLLDVVDHPVRPDLTILIARETQTPLIHVEYPGLVLNNDRVIRTLGGTAKLSNVIK
jgi:hypothetical protein